MLPLLFAALLATACSDPEEVQEFVDAATAADGGDGLSSDGSMNDASAPTDGVALAEVEKGLRATFYDPLTVQTIELHITADNLAKMHAALPDRIYVPATFRWGDFELKNVGVRYKGNSSSNPNAKHKRSFLIKVNEFEKGRRLFGLRRIALDNGVQFGSLFSERLIGDTLRKLGVVSPRSNYVRLLLNGKEWGVYVNVERIDKSFMTHHFGDNEGLLYKVHLGGPGASLELLPDAKAYNGAFAAKSDAADGGFDALRDLCEVIKNTPDDQLAKTLAGHLELDDFLRSMAVFVLAGAFDQYTGWNPHNYYLHRPATGSPWTYLAWDLDVGFADNAFGCIKVIDEWSAAWPLPRVPRPLLERILDHPTLLARYRTFADEILEAHFRPEQLGPRLVALYAQIEAPLKTDPFPPVRVTVPTDTGYPSILASMKAFFAARYKTARAQLDAPAKVPPAKPCQPGGQGPKPGPLKEMSPTDLKVVAISEAGIELSWVDNAKGEAAHVVQRCGGKGCTNFQNAMGLMGDDITKAVDDKVMAGMTYRYRVYAVFPSPGGPTGSGVSNVVEATAK